MYIIIKSGYIATVVLIMFLRVKPVRKLNKNTGKSTTYHYVYEVESYKKWGKVRQKTVGLLGRYIQLEKQNQKNFPLEKALQADSKEQLLREIFALQLENYDFRQIGSQIYKQGDVIANLKTFRVFSEASNKDVYVNINDKFFGTKTLRKAAKSDIIDLFEFVKAIIDSGAVGIEFSEFKRIREAGGEPAPDFKLLQAIIGKFGPVTEDVKEISFEKFKSEIGY